MIKQKQVSESENKMVMKRIRFALVGKSTQPL